ncbi:MAG: phosphonopyruvate decarboxylase, partial [Xanthobacteraceae bacterium]
ASLGGQRAALLMQSSGVGNCINMFSLLRNCGFPLRHTRDHARGVRGIQSVGSAYGTITEDVLGLCGFLVHRVDRADAVGEIVGAARNIAFERNVQAAVLLSQRLIGPKQWTR